MSRITDSLHQCRIITPFTRDINMSNVLKLSIIAYQPQTPSGRWAAIDQNSYDGDTNQVGWGETQLEAVADLIELMQGSQA